MIARYFKHTLTRVCFIILLLRRGKDSRERTPGKGFPEKDSRKRTPGKGFPEKDSRKRTLRKGFFGIMTYVFCSVML